MNVYKLYVIKEIDISLTKIKLFSQVINTSQFNSWSLIQVYHFNDYSNKISSKTRHKFQ